MEWIETAQKVAPWAASLPIPQKVVLSAMILSVGTFALLLLWYPAAPAPVSTENSSSIGVSSPLTIIVNSSASAAAATAQFAQELSAQAGLDKLDRNVEKDDLKRIIRNLVSIEYSQAPLPWLLKGYVNKSRPDNWGQVQAIVASTAPIIGDVARSLAEFDGDLVFKDLETYKRLRKTIAARAGLYASLSKMPPPSTAEEKAELL